MAAPLTQFEIDGTWTPLAAEEAFLSTLDSETATTVTVAGTSRAGRPIHRVDLGTGTAQTLLITSLLHGDEVASREALLAFLRDLAYSTDLTDLAYLAAHRIVALTSCNPDGFPNSRAVPGVPSGQNNNINRDVYGLTLHETRVIMDTLTAVQPHLVLDIHEYHGSLGDQDWLYRAGGHPITHPAVHAAENALATYGVAIMQGEGYTTLPYWLNSMPRQAVSTVAGPLHAVGFLSETNLAHDPTYRVTIQRRVLDITRDWHATNAQLCTDAGAQSRQAATGPVAPVPLYTETFIGRDRNPPTLDISGYQLAGPLPALHADTFGIIADPDGFVTLQQEARWVIPTLLDPESPDAVSTAERVHPAPGGLQLYLSDGRPAMLMRTNGQPAMA